MDIALLHIFICLLLAFSASFPLDLFVFIFFVPTAVVPDDVDGMLGVFDVSVEVRHWYSHWNCCPRQGLRHERISVIFSPLERPYSSSE